MNLNTGKTILSLCDYSGNWCLPYREAGYNVVRVDLNLPQLFAPADNETLIQKDVRLLKLSDLPANIHGILAAPPCTHFAICGANHWAKKGDRAVLEGLSIVDSCFRIIFALAPAWWALENPTGRLSKYIGKARMIFQPFEFGDPYTKATCLWGTFDSDMKKSPVKPRYARMVGHRGSLPYQFDQPTTDAERKIYRSVTPLGFARAFFESNP